MSDEIIPGSMEDVNPEGYSELTLDNYSPKSQEVPPVVYEICTICGFPFGRNKMVRYQKRWYCKPNGCYRDIVGMRLNENPDAHFKDDGLADRFWKGD